MVGTARFEARIRELVADIPDLAILVEPLLIVRQALREQFGILHRRLLAVVRDDEVCRRLMTVPGVGPVVAQPIARRSEVEVGGGRLWINPRPRPIWRARLPGRHIAMPR